MKTLMFAAATGLLALSAASQADAAKSNLLATHGVWEAYAYADKAGKVCYIASVPQKTEGSAKGRETFVTVTHRTADKSTNVVNVVAGYAYKAASPVEVEIGANKFKLFTSGDGAWAKDGATDQALVEMMKKGNSLVVRGTPTTGKPTVDTYSLAGFGAAYADIGKACNVK